MSATKDVGLISPAAIAATLAAVVATLARGETSVARLSGDPDHGKTVYEVCMGCHSLDEDDVGPKHRGVVGRMAGAVPGYAYSLALKNSGLTWDADNLDRWLTNPQALVPGTKMFFTLANAKDRADVIAYLAEQR